MAKLGDRVVVMGASMGGLATAWTVGSYFETVTIVERDAVADSDQPRRGAPQGRRPLAMLARGCCALQPMFLALRPYGLMSPQS